MNWANFKQTVIEVKSFFFSFAIATVICAIFGYLWVFYPGVVASVDEFFRNLGIPARIDFVQYFICVLPIAIAGFLHGYKKPQTSKIETRWSRIDNGFFYFQLYTMVGLIYGPCIWDNIIILYRVIGPEHLNLAAQMEIQFIFIFFLSISAYRVFTILYVIVGTYFVLYVRKRSQILCVYLFFIYIYSSLVIGLILGLNLYPTSFYSEAIRIYLLSALIILVIIVLLSYLIKRYKEKMFD